MAFIHIWVSDKGYERFMKSKQKQDKIRKFVYQTLEGEDTEK